MNLVHESIFNFKSTEDGGIIRHPNSWLVSVFIGGTVASWLDSMEDTAELVNAEYVRNPGLHLDMDMDFWKKCKVWDHPRDAEELAKECFRGVSMESIGARQGALIDLVLPCMHVGFYCQDAVACAVEFSQRRHVFRIVDTQLCRQSIALATVLKGGGMMLFNGNVPKSNVQVSYGEKPSNKLLSMPAIHKEFAADLDSELVGEKICEEEEGRKVVWQKEVQLKLQKGNECALMSIRNCLKMLDTACKVETMAMEHCTDKACIEFYSVIKSLVDRFKAAPDKEYWVKPDFYVDTWEIQVRQLLVSEYHVSLLYVALYC